VTLVDYKVLIVIQQWLYQTKVYDGAYDAGEAKQRIWSMAGVAFSKA